MSTEAKKNAVCIMGPTGTGKSSLAIRLATLFPMEIVNVDSVQIYKDLNIGNAKPSPIQQKKIRHHLFDICDLEETYSAARFCDDARKICAEILSRGRMPLFVGGTGLYFKSLLNGLSRLPPSNSVIRFQLESDLERIGTQEMHSRLRVLDSVAADRIHPRDIQRIIRALEVCILSEKSMTELFETKVENSNFLQPVKFVLHNEDRDYLRDRLHARFISMLGRGLINEVAFLRDKKRLAKAPAALNSVGYREVWNYLEDKLDYEEMVSRAVISSYQLAKRQTTWFRKESDCVRCESSNKDALFVKIRDAIEKADIF